MAALVRSILLVFIYFYVLKVANEVEGIRLLSEEEDLELEDQLKRLNKPAIRSIETKYGMYDCIDFYKQPAFDHPLLKNHDFYFQMRPSFVPRAMNEKKINMINNIKVLDVDLKIEGCLSGTVPIKKVTKYDLIQAKLHFERHGFGNSKYVDHPPYIHFAVVQTPNDQPTTYNGGGTTLSVYNPHVEDSQYSSARMIIQIGKDSIQFGWMVNPGLYNDNNTHMFIYSKAGQSQCFNLQCSGFVLVHKDLPIDKVFENVSKKGGPIVFLKFLIHRDPVKGNWWLRVGEEEIGFWPRSIFTDTENMATGIEWGGEVFGPRDIPSPPMGSGELVNVDKKNSNNDAICGLLTVINDAQKVVGVENIVAKSDTNYYNVIGPEKSTEGYGSVMFYGGPGGATS